VIGNVGVHRADDGDVVDMLRRVRKQLADLDAAFAILLELKRRGECRAGLPLGAEVLGRQVLAGVFVERDLAVERIDVARAAVHEQVDHPLGLRRKMRGARERVGFASAGRAARSARRRQTEKAGPYRAGEKVTAGNWA
jgi:hypothetical protein